MSKRRPTEQEINEWKAMTNEQRELAGPWLIPLLLNEVENLKEIICILSKDCPTYSPVSSRFGPHGKSCNCSNES